MTEPRSSARRDGAAWHAASWRLRAALLACAIACWIAAPAARAQDQPPAAPFLRIETGMHTDQVRRVVASPDGALFATVSADKTARIWAADGALVRTLRPPIAGGHEGSLRAAALSAERRLLVTAGTTGSAWGRREAIVYIFDLDGDRMQRLRTGVPAEVSALAFAPGGQRLVIGFADDAGLATFDFATNELVTAPNLGIRQGVTGLALDAAGNLAVGAGDGRVHLFGPQLARLAAPRPLPEGGQPGDLAFSPDGRMLAVGVVNMPAVRLLDGRTLEPRGTPRLAADLGRQRQHLRAVAWTRGANGQPVLHAAGYVLDPQGRSVALRWGNLTAAPAGVTPLGADAVFHLAALGDGRVAFAAGDPAWGTFGPDGRVVLQLDRQGNDHRAAAAGLFRVTPDGTEFGLFPDRGPGSFRVSPDGLVVEFGTLAGGVEPRRFDVLRRSLEPAAAAALPPPAERQSLPLRDWLNGASPQLGAQRLALDPSETARSAAPLPDGQGFLLGTDTGIRWFAADGRPVAAAATEATVFGIAIAAEARMAVLALGDGTLRWHDLEPGADLAERAAFFAHRDGRRWIMWTPEGFFDHSEEGGQDLAGFHLNRRAQDPAEWVNFSQLYRLFRAEELVRTRLSRGDEEPIRDRLAAIGDVRRLLQGGAAPGIVLTALCFAERAGEAERCQPVATAAAATRGLMRVRETARPPTVAAGPAAAPAVAALELPAGVTRVRLRATLTDRGGGIGQTDLFLNDRNVGRSGETRGLGRARPAQPQPTPAAAPAEYERVLDLDPGVNTLQLRAFDAQNETFAQSVVVQLRAAPARSAPARPTLHVLAIGVNDYAATAAVGLRSLVSAVPDAEALVEALRARVAADYGGLNAILLTDRAATLDGIEAAFARLRAVVRPEDTVLIYLAGHGMALRDRYLFMPFQRGELELEAATAGALDDRRLVELWSALPARNSMLLIDTCHAGAFTMDFAGALQNETGRLVLAAASAQQVALDRVRGTRHGPFSLAIQEALRGEARRRMMDDATDQLTLGFHVRERTPALAAQAGVEQRVAFRLTNGDLPSPFPLTRLTP
jgi:hypothetical protein